MRRLTFVAFVVGLIAMAAPSVAQSPIVIVLDGLYRGDTGTVQLIESVAVEPGLVGATCTGSGQLENNASIHPDNDLIISSGGSSGEITDYESEAGAIIPLVSDGPFVLGETIDFSVRFGGNGLTSLGLTVTLDCVPPPPETTTTTTTAPPETTTTTAPPETTTTAPPETTTTTAAPTTTTSPPPLGAAGAGAGGTADSDALALYALGAAGIVLAGAGATAAWRMRGER